MTLKTQMMAGVGLAVLALAPPMAARAAAAVASDKGNQIEEVVVTATKTGATNLQKTALAVAVVGGEDLVKRQSVTIKDLPLLVPALKISQNSSTPTVYIRGVGGSNGGEADVSLYFDGVYLGRNSVAVGANFNDLARIEVLTGPQGTLFGRNSPGGAINYISETPSRSFKLKNTLTFGNFNLFGESLALSGPITDRVQGSFSIDHYRRDAYLENIVPGKPDLGNANRTAVRTQLRWEVTDTLVTTMRADWMWTDEHWATNVTAIFPNTTFPNALVNTIIGDYKKVAIDGPIRLREQAYGISNETSWTLNEHLTLKSLFAYRTDKSLGQTDTDTSDITLSISDTYYHQHQYSEELNLQNTFGPFSGVVGLFYYNEAPTQLTHARSPAVIGNGRPAGSGSEAYQLTNQPTTSYAAYFQEAYHFTPNLSFSVGARYTTERKKLDTDNETLRYATGVNDGKPTNAGTPPTILNPFIANLSKEANSFTPKFSLDWQATPDALIYVSATKGYKSGGYSNGARSTIGADFGPESLWAYELGAKTEWFDRRLRVNIDAYYYDWTGLQFTIQIQPQVNVTGNAAAAHIQGVDADIIWKATDKLTLTASASLLPEAAYDDFKKFTVSSGVRPYIVGDPRYNVAGGYYDATGKRIVNTPKVSLTLTAQQDFDLPDGSTMYVRGEYSHTSLTYFEPTNSSVASRGAVSLYDASVGYSPKNAKWEFVAWAKNLTDEAWTSYVTLGTVPAYNMQAPRTFGVRVNYAY